LQTKRLAEWTGREPPDKTVRKDAKKIRAAILRLAPAFASLSAWLRGVAALASANNLPLRWEHADGFVVLQDSRRLKKGRDQFYLPGHKRSIDYGTKEPTEAIDTHAQERQAAANYVHSYDAMLLREVLRGALSARLGVACAHDSFACHPNELGTLRGLMVGALSAVYSDSPLVRLRSELEAQGVFNLPAAHIPQMDAGFSRGDLAT
jgi:DNA-directed RNA polymerase